MIWGKPDLWFNYANEKKFAFDLKLEHMLPSKRLHFYLCWNWPWNIWIQMVMENFVSIQVIIKKNYLYVTWERVIKMAYLKTSNVANKKTTPDESDTLVEGHVNNLTKSKVSCDIKWAIFLPIFYEQLYDSTFPPTNHTFPNSMKLGLLIWWQEWHLFASKTQTSQQRESLQSTPVATILTSFPVLWHSQYCLVSGTNWTTEFFLYLLYVATNGTLRWHQTTATDNGSKKWLNTKKIFFYIFFVRKLLLLSRVIVCSYIFWIVYNDVDVYTKYSNSYQKFFRHFILKIYKVWRLIKLQVQTYYIMQNIEHDNTGMHKLNKKNISKIDDKKIT